MQTQQAAQPLPPSLWASTAIPAVPLTALDTNLDVDVLIIGAGYTGLSTALHLAQQGTNVCILDANQPGWGASGRNGGQVNPTLKHDPDELCHLLGDKVAEPLIDTIATSADLVYGLIDQYKIDCHPVRQGWLQTSYTEKGVSALHTRAEKWAKRGFPVEILDKTALAKRMGTHAFVGGWLDGRAGSVQPLSYARGLARAVIEQGAHIYTNTAVTALSKSQHKWKAITQKGLEVHADKVVIATNGYTDALWPGLKQTILTANSFIVATAPLQGEDADNILKNGETASTAQRLLLYMRRDEQGRLLIGGRGHFNEPSGASDFAHLERSLTLLYPQLGKPEYQYRWAGRIAITRDFMPHVHEPAPGIIMALGCNGRGIALCTAMGKALAEHLNHPSTALSFPVSPIKPIPLHQLQRFYIAAGVTLYSFLDRFNA